jgi:hypothetical protein
MPIHATLCRPFPGGKSPCMTPNRHRPDETLAEQAQRLMREKRERVLARLKAKVEVGTTRRIVRK